MLKTKDGYAKVIGTSYQGSSDYLLLSNGDSKAISSLSVNYATSAGNADTLDGAHLNGIFTAFGNDENNISATVGGVTKKFEVKYSNHSYYSRFIKGDDQRNANNAPSYYMNTFGYASLYTEFSQQGKQFGNGTYVNLITSTPWRDSGGGRPAQLAIGNYIGLRSAANDSTWGAWRTIPTIDANGVMEIGKFIDWHWNNEIYGSQDFSTRLQAQNTSSYPNTVYLPTQSGELALLDQVELSQYHVVDMRNYDSGYWHPVTVGLPKRGYNKIKVSVELNIGDKPSWATHSEGFTCNMEIWATAHGWGTTNAETICLNYTYAHCNSNPCGWKQLGYPSLGVLFLRGGARYKVWTDFDATFTPHDKTYTWTSEGGTTQSTGGPYTSCPGLDFIKNKIYANLDGTADNADKLDGYHASYSSSTPWGTIPVITTQGFMDIGKYLEFHFDNTTGSDYSTILRCTGNYSNIVNLPSESGTLALTKDVLTFSNESADYLSANFNNPDFSKKAASKYIECWDGEGGWWNWMAGKFMKAGSSDAYVLLGGGGHKPLSEFSMVHTHPYLPLIGGTVTGNIILKGETSADMTYAGNVHPYIRFDNSDSSQNVSLIFTDYDTYKRPAGIKLVGNQGNEWFEAANIYATTFYGALSGNASSATTLQTTRTLWGQSFNGSNNVSGNMSSVGQITFSALSGTNGRALLYQQMADNDYFRIYAGGTASNSGYVEIATADDGNEPIYVRQYTGVFSSVKRTLTLLDANGYTHFPSYINIGGNENNNSSPDRVWGSNGSDSYLRSYRTSALRVSYANSAGNADTVDGYHADKYLMVPTTIDATSLNSDTYYPVTIGLPCKNTRIEVEVSLDSGTKPSWSTHPGGFTSRKVWESNGSGWGITSVERNIFVSTYSFASEDPIRGIGQLTNSSVEFVYVRGGGKYYFRVSVGGGIPTLRKEKYTTNSQSVEPTTTAPDLIVPCINTPHRRVTLWGQSFNGTNNVSGSLSNTGTITASAAATYDIGSNALDYRNGYFQWIGAKSNTNLRLAANNSDNQIVLHTNGNVGIGTTSPAYKLHVAGDIYTTTGFKKNGSSDSYVLLGGGGHQTISSLSVNYANSAGSVAWNSITGKPSSFTPSAHSHDGRYLRLDGSDTMTGVFKAKANQFNDGYDGAINMNNSDIYGLNSIYTADRSDAQAEGIHFWRDSTHVDTLRMVDGKLLFTPNRPLGGSGTEQTVLHTGNSYIQGSTITINGSSITPLTSLPSHTHSWTSITDKLVAGNEFNIVNAGFNAGMWFNYVPINDRSKTATITGYHFGNGATGYTSIKASGFIKNGSSSSYVLLGDGGHQTISSLSVNYASSAGNADTVDGYHASSLVKFYLSPMASDAPADSAKSWFINTMPSASGAIVYNVPGSEKTIIAGKSSGAFGHMLQLNYDNTYLKILRYHNGSWKSTDWEKISAGYADSAGSVTWDNVTGKPSSLKNPYSLNIFGVAYDGSAAKTVTTSTFISQLSEGPSTVTDGTMFITSWASDSGFADTNAVNVPYKRKASCLWNYIDSKVSSKYLPLAGGTMNGNARIGHGSGNLYIGNLGNDGWIYTQDIASQKGIDKWSIRESGATHFGALYIASKTDNSFNSNVIECNSTINLNYFSSQNVSLCNGGGTVQIGSYTTGDTGNNKLYVNGSEFINGASNVKDHVFANGFRHRSHNSDDSVLLAGGGYSQGVPVRYWAIYYMYIGNSSTDVTYTKRSGNYNFITSEAWESEGSARFDISFPSGYNKNNTLIFGNGDHRTSSSWKTPVYVTITTSTAFGGASQIRVMISDDANLNVGFANIYFMCMG